MSSGFRIPIVRRLISKLEGASLFYNGNYVGQSRFPFIAQLRLVFLRSLILFQKFCSIIFSGYCHIEAFTESYPRDENYVQLNNENSKLNVRFELGESEVEDLSVLIKHFQEIFNTKVLFCPRRSRLKRFVNNDASHHMGGIVCGKDSSDSVVDLNFRVHGTENIFVCGGAVSLSLTL